METVLSSLNNIESNRGKFSQGPNVELTSSVDNIISLIYKKAYSTCSNLKSNSFKKSNSKTILRKWLLPDIIMENMDSEQIWQQLELWNCKALPMSIQYSSWSLLKENRNSENESEDEDNESEEFVDDERVDISKIDSFERASTSNESEGFENLEDEASEDTGSSRSNILNLTEEKEDHKKTKDQFFNMDEFEKFADGEIDEEGDEMIYSDYITDVVNEKDNAAKYYDFFEPELKKSKIENDEPLSALEKKQAIEKRTREQLEDENVADKPWLMFGEVDAKQRPQNSLLEHHVEFDHATRIAPTVTEDFSKGIEELIKQRIIDKAWDDVERKVKPVEDINEFRRRAVLDSEKSKLSLAELYEKDYVDRQREQQPLNFMDIAEEEKVKKIKDEMRDLFIKLDALSHYQFTPKAPVPELQITKNTPSANIEEPAPVTVSNANLLAPTEVKRPISGELKSKDEQSETDRKRARRRAKAHMRAKQKTKMERLTEKAASGDKKASKLLALQKLKTGSRVKIAQEENKISKKKSKKGSSSTDQVSKATKSSSEFFSRLQDEVDAQVQQRNDKKKIKGAH